MSAQSQAGGESNARRGRVAAPRSGGRSLRLLLASALIGSAVAGLPASAQAPSVLVRGPGERKFSPLRGAAGVYDYGGTWSRKFRWLGTLPRAQFEAETRGNDLLAESTSKVVRLTTVHRDAGR